MANFRLCPDTGLFFDKNAESLIKVNAVAAVVSLLVAGILALGVALTRWPAVHLLPADQFYMFLTAHGVDACSSGSSSSKSRFSILHHRHC